MNTVKVTDTSSEYLKRCHAPKQPVVFGILYRLQKIFLLSKLVVEQLESLCYLLMLIVLNIHKVNDMQLKQTNKKFVEYLIIPVLCVQVT